MPDVTVVSGVCRRRLASDNRCIYEQIPDRKVFPMGKWSAFLISLIPAALAGYLCFLLVTIGLPAVDEMGPVFWGPVGAGFLACVMCLLAPFGIAIFVKSAPKAAPVQKAAAEKDDEFDTADSAMLSGEEVAYEDEAEDDMSADSDDDMYADAEDEDDFDYGASSEFESAELASDEFSDEFDAFEDDYDDEEKA